VVFSFLFARKGVAMSRHFVCILLAGLCLVLLPQSALAQPAEWGTVSGVGSATLRPKPTKLRVQMSLQSYGKSVESALERLKVRRETVAGKLRAMKAAKESISFGGPSVVKIAPGGAPGYSPMAVPPSLPGEAVPVLPATPLVPVPAPEAAPAPAPPPTFAPATVRKPVVADNLKAATAPEPRELFSATATVTAEWPLDAETTEQALATAEAIRKRIAAADLTSTKGADKLSAEEQELLEESRGGGTTTVTPQPMFAPAPSVAYVEPSGAGNSQPFQYVAPISAQQRKAALAEAFVKAKTQAAEVAEAAGGKLGPIVSVSGEASGTRPPFVYGPYGPEAGYAFGMPPGMNESDGEAVSTDPARLEFRVRVSAQFRLQ
jgi:uncharacterized protein YggE